MHVTRVQTFLWLFPTIVESVIVLAIAYRKLWHSLPIFLSYLVFEIIRTCVLFSVRGSAITYFYFYWISEALGCLAALCVIKELFDNAFERRLGLRQLGNVLFQWSIAVLLVAAILVAWMSPGKDAQKLMAGIYVIKRSLTFVEAGLLGFLLLFAFAFGIPWQHYAMGVFGGFGIYGAIELSAITARAEYGRSVIDWVNWAVMLANNCCVLTWAAYFLIPVQEKPMSKIDLAQSRKLLEEWNEALMQIMKR